MAARLGTWLARGPLRAHGSMAEAAADYADNGCFVDCARQALAGGDSNAALAPPSRHC